MSDFKFGKRMALKSTPGECVRNNVWRNSLNWVVKSRLE